MKKIKIKKQKNRSFSTAINEKLLWKTANKQRKDGIPQKYAWLVYFDFFSSVNIDNFNFNKYVVKKKKNKKFLFLTISHYQIGIKKKKFLTVGGECNLHVGYDTGDGYLWIWK